MEFGVILLMVLFFLFMASFAFEGPMAITFRVVCIAVVVIGMIWLACWSFSPEPKTSNFESYSTQR